jgi:hypothetical protein
MSRRAMNAVWGAMVGVVAGTVLAGASGCLPTSEPGLGSRDPAMRLNSMLDAAATGDKSAVPGLISRLDSQDGGERLLAINALRRITGETHGYDHAGPPAERDAAIRSAKGNHETRGLSRVLRPENSKARPRKCGKRSKRRLGRGHGRNDQY